ncbi:MAG: phospholipid carrier-dependent glycosyltransferase [Herbaspirillum sp.]|jgi:4-amino-4-deoxy-L-arabinose transferase-like glycosyltransferase|nr:phospholipid carrier-dependent glycosyltransferase [Herbaspirillum sp.]
MRELHKSPGFLWGLLILFALVWFYLLGVRTLVPSDEGRYAEMAREMFANHDWITTRLNGIKYFEKPPLQAWMNALTFELFGLGEWQARLWTGLCGFFGVLLTGYTGGRVFGGRVGFYGALVLGSSLLWSGLGHVNTLDTGLAAMMTLSLCSLLIAQRNHATYAERRNWMLVCWFSMALAVLSKGLIGIVLPGAVLVLYSLFARDLRIWKRLHLLTGLLLFFVVSAPWFIVVSMRNPEFARFFFIHEHFQRFTTKIHQRTGAWYYFVPILVAGIIPWLGVLLQSLWEGLRDRHESSLSGSLDGTAGRGFQPKKMLLIWVLFIFLFFSISDSKLPSYILPIIPALALLIAAYLNRAGTGALYLTAAIFGLPAAIGLAFVARIPATAKNAFSAALLRLHLPWIYAALALVVAGAIVAALMARRHKDGAIVLLALTGFLAGQIVIVGHDPQGRYSAGVEHLPAIRAELTPDTQLYMVGLYEQALPFYLQRTATLVAHEDEMAFGLEHEPQLWIPTVEAFAEKWKADNAAGKKEMAILQPDIYPRLQQLGIPMRIIGSDPRRIIISNRMDAAAVDAPGAAGKAQ